MKISVKSQSNKVLSLKLIKYKIYKPKFQNELNDTKLKLKMNLKIIFKYFLANKKILFVGIENKFNSFIYKLIKSTSHSYIPNSLWFKGVLTNSKIVFKYLVLSKNLNKFIKFLFNLKSKTNLILMFGEKPSNLNEFLGLKTPIISFFHFNKLYDYCLSSKT
uniref:Ribosomal protein S2 n=1 Tax=Entomoneis sp. TaxID=186043 RepID=A0A3G1PWD1_9STRA|nr:ribosomal protein S2 [Entomoneis sp.]